MGRYIRQPHTLPALATVQDSEIATLEAIDVKHLLAEPDNRAGEWIAACIRRVLAMSSGPVCVGLDTSPLLERLETAGLLNIAQGSSVQDASIACWPILQELRRLNVGYGSARPTLVIVGENSNSAEQLPFASRGGAWLFNALRILGHDELSTYLTNVKTPAGRVRKKLMSCLHSTLAPMQPVWIATGKETARCMRKIGIKCVEVQMPIWARLYKRKLGPEYYANLLHEAGVPYGPYKQRPLALCKVDTLPDLIAPYDIRTCAFSKGKSESRRGDCDRPLDDFKREQARRMYVTGQLTSYKEIAHELNITPSQVSKVARLDGWVAERDDYQRSITEQAKAKAAQAEVRAMVRARRLAWVATVNELDAVVQSQQSASYEASAGQARALSQIALSLSEVGATEDSAESDVLARKTVVEIAQEALRRVHNNLGGGLDDSQD